MVEDAPFPLGEIDARLLWADSLPGHLRNAATIGQLLIEIKQRNQYDFVWLERRLRYLGTRIYLLAAPKEKLGKGLAVDAKHWLWIGVNGGSEAARQRAAFGVTRAENLEHLADCGFPYIVGPIDPTETHLLADRLPRA